MTPDERTALNEAVCKRLGWTAWWGDTGLEQPDFTSDWNAVYRWIVPAVKEANSSVRVRFSAAVFAIVTEREPARTAAALIYALYATPEDYCRAFLAVTEVNE